jgi:hypothetical protein
VRRRRRDRPLPAAAADARAATTCAACSTIRAALAAASPLEAARGAEQRHATVGRCASVAAASTRSTRASIAFTNGAGAYAWELRDRDEQCAGASGTGNWSAGTPIALNGFELQLDGVPAAATVSRSRRPAPRASNGNALALAALARRRPRRWPDHHRCLRERDGRRRRARAGRAQRGPISQGVATSAESQRASARPASTSTRRPRG